MTAPLKWWAYREEKDLNQHEAADWQPPSKAELRRRWYVFHGEADGPGLVFDESLSWCQAK
jgi:hypothetical protein